MVGFKRKFSYAVGDKIYVVSWSTINREYIISEMEIGFIKLYGTKNVDIIYFNSYGDFLGTEEEVNVSMFIDQERAEKKRDENNKALYNLEEKDDEVEK